MLKPAGLAFDLEPWFNAARPGQGDTDARNSARRDSSGSPEPDLPRLLSAVVSVTSDMGVEQGLADVVNADGGQWLPHWQHADALETDDGTTAHALQEQSAAGYRYLFRAAIPIADGLHILDGITQSMLPQIPAWEWPEA